MKIKSYDNFTACYHDLTREVMLHSDHECAPRGMAIREILGATFRIEDPRNRLPYIPERNYSLCYLLAECTWYIAGRNDVEWIAKYSPFWLDVTDDGRTANSSYGSRIFRAHDRVDGGAQIQYDRVLKELKSDPDSRRAVIYLTQAVDHRVAQKDIGCATNLQFFIRDGKLNQIANMRSSDLILGIPYDVGAFTIVQEMLALELGVELGWYQHHSNSLHVYERNFEVAEAVCNASVTSDCPPMPKMTSLPPISKMIELEEMTQHVTDPAELSDLYRSIRSRIEDQYWQEWCASFVTHRAKKINKKLKQEVIDGYTFPGYRRFKK